MIDSNEIIDIVAKLNLELEALVDNTTSETFAIIFHTDGDVMMVELNGSHVVWEGNRDYTVDYADIEQRIRIRVTEIAQQFSRTVLYIQ